MRQLREDMAQLIKSGHEHIAFNRVEQLIKDESTAAVYELLDNFCEFILVHLSYIRRHKECPNDINEAVSSLIFASARCGDLPELRVIRKLFGERYGQRFAMTAVELFPGNLVNLEIKEKLSTKSVPDDVKHRMVDEIARDYCLKPEVLALEYYPEWQKQQFNEDSGDQVLDIDVQTSQGTNKRFEMQGSRGEEIERKFIFADSLSTNKNISTEPCNSPCHQDFDITGTFTGSSIVQSTSSSIVQQSFPNAVESPMPNEVQKLEKDTGKSSHKYKISGLEHKEVKTGTVSSSESLPQFSEEAIVYLDDIEEFQSFTRKDGDCQDQRVFKFASSVLPKGEKLGIGRDQSNMDLYVSTSEKSGSRSHRESGKASGKRLRRRSVHWENQSMKNIECLIYYDKPGKTSPSNHPRKHQKKTLGMGRQQSYYAHKRLNKPCCLEVGSNLQSFHFRYEPKESFFDLELDDSSLRHPFYFRICDGKDNSKALTCQEKRGTTTLVGFPSDGPEPLLLCSGHRHWFWNGESDKEIEGTTIPSKPRRSYDSVDTVYNLFTYLDYQPCKQDKEMKGKADRSDSTSRCVSSSIPRETATDSLRRKLLVPPYSRAETMPPERPKDSCKEAMLRSNSCPQYPNHVHPKLPDYDALSAKFKALKKEHVQNRVCGSNINIGEDKVI